MCVSFVCAHVYVWVSVKIMKSKKQRTGEGRKKWILRELGNEVMRYMW